MKKLVTSFVVATRVAIGFVFIQMAGQKLVYEDFYNKGLPERMADTISALQENELGWKIFAISQITIALLLITQRFATLGAILLFPMMAGLFIMSLDTPGSIKITNGALTALTILLIVYDYRKLKSAFVSATSQSIEKENGNQIYDILVGLGILLVIIGFTCKINGMLEVHAYVTIFALIAFALVPLVYAFQKTKTLMKTLTGTNSTT